MESVDKATKLWCHIGDILLGRLWQMEESAIRDSFARREPFQSLIRDTPIDETIDLAHLTELAFLAYCLTFETGRGGEVESTGHLSNEL